MSKKLCTLILLLNTLFAVAQTNNDPVYMNYSNFPSVKMDKVDEDASLQVLEANLIIPKFNFGKKTEVYTNINYRSYFFNYKNESINLAPDQLNDIRLGFIIRHKFNENWEMIISPRANMRTDFSEESGKYGIFPSVNLIGVKNAVKIKNLSYGLGLSYNNDLNKNTIIALGYLKYHNEKMRVYAILPSFAYFIMTPTEKFEYGLSYNLDAAIFHADKVLLSDSQNYLKSSTITIAPTIGYNFTNKFWLNAKAGYAMFRRFQYVDSSFEDLAFTKDNKFNSGLYFNFGISMRL